ncbi:MAG: hypothetical protein ACR2O0_02665 [Rhizobiaceae bacterium]
MEKGVLITLGVAFAIIILAMVLTRLFSRGKPEKHDLNGRAGSGRADATWAGIKHAQRDIDHD